MSKLADRLQQRYGLSLVSLGSALLRPGNHCTILINVAGFDWEYPGLFGGVFPRAEWDKREVSYAALAIAESPHWTGTMPDNLPFSPQTGDFLPGLMSDSLPAIYPEGEIVGLLAHRLPAPVAAIAPIVLSAGGEVAQ